MWNPTDYAKNSDGQLKWARDLRSRLVLRGDESVLDVGCGDGKITADFAAALPQGHIVGIDSSPEMIAYAARTYGDSPNLSFACHDARAFDFQPEFDIVFSNATLHWFADHPAFLRRAAQALLPGGRLIISCGGRGNAAGVLQAFAEITARPRWQAYFDSFTAPYSFYGPDEYAPWLRDAGFTVDRLELAPKDMVHDGAEGLLGWIRTTWMPFTDRVPEDERSAFTDELIQTYLERVPLDVNGKAHVQMVRLEVEARRS